MGVTEIQGLVPPVLYPVFVAITYFGSVSTVLVGLSVLYWLDGRERTAFVMSSALGGVASTVALKAVFALPRPPLSGRLIAVSGYGFPSGHAIVSTVVYGSLALVLTEIETKLRVTGAAVVVALVSLSRVVLGVHYPGQVVAGVAFGLGYLAVAAFVLGRDPGAGFLLAVLVAGVALVTTHLGVDGVGVLGSTVGAALSWHAVDAPPADQSGRVRLALVAVGLPIVGVLGYLAGVHQQSILLVFLASGLLTAVVLGLPAIGDHVSANRTARVARPDE